MTLNVVLPFCDSFATANFLHTINQCDSPYNLLILNATLQLLSPSFPRFIYLKLEWSTSLAEYQWGNKSIKELQCGIQNKNILDNSHFLILCTQLFNVFCLICDLRIIYLINSLSLQLLLKLFQSACCLNGVFLCGYLPPRCFFSTVFPHMERTDMSPISMSPPRA